MIEIKIQEYENYILEHQANVRKAWEFLQKKLKGEFWIDDYNFYRINHLIQIHDASKFNHDEFSGYRQWFFTTENENKNKDLFNVAWLHHKNRNPHHWNYWVLDREPLQMPFIYVIEMLCDWKAMSLKFKDCPHEYYIKNKNKMILHKDTMKYIERWISLFKSGGEND